MSNNNDKLICRGCLSDKQELLNSLLDNPKLMELYTNCTHLQINYNDPLPKNLCSTCVNKCFLWNSFKEMCTINESVLLGQLGEQKSIENPIEMLQPTMSEETIKVEFEEITIKNEILSSDDFFEEITMTECEDDDYDKIKMLDDTESSSDSWNRNPTTEIGNHSKDKSIEDHLHQKNGMSLECDECGEKFKNKRLIKVHMNKKHHKKKHLGIRPYKCQICQISFTTKVLLTSHMQGHTGENPYSCTQCDKSFKMKSHLKTHYRLHLDKSILCSQCGKTFNTEFKLKMHMFDHTQQWPHKCSICDKGFKVKYKLKLHMRVHTGERPFPCTLCNKTYRSQSDLKEHQQTHMAYRPFKCTQCENSYYSSSNLKTHMRRHTGEKPYGCNKCYKAYTTSAQLKLHISSHSGERPFKCHDCGISYKRKLELFSHMKLHSSSSNIDQAAIV